MNEQTMLKVERLTKTYETAGGRDLTVLRDVSFGLGAGASVAIVGPSGSGKTTLLGLCAGLDQPSSGTVELAGQSIGALSEDARALVRNQHVGFVFQNFQLVPTLTALENVMVPVELRGQGGVDAEAEARGLLTRVGLGEPCDHYPEQLSGGEQQRVALARALSPDPAILLADEPTGNLDEATGKQIIDLLFAKHAERGMTLVLVTHDHSLAQRCDHVVRLRSGRVDTEAAGKSRSGVA
jgi:putative ABC transport system ATP-binding protein